MKIKLYEGRKQVESILSTIRDGKEYVDFILSIDSSRTKKYADVIAKWLKKYYSESEKINVAMEPTQRISYMKDVIKRATSELPELITKAEARNISFDISTIDEIEDLIKILKEKLKKITRSSIKKGFAGLTLDKDYGIIIQNQNFIGVIPYSWEASRTLASSTVGGVEGKWCISYQKTDDYWKSIVLSQSQAPCFLISLNSKDTWKYAFMVKANDSIEIWSSEDVHIKNVPNEKKVLETLEINKETLTEIIETTRKKALANIKDFNSGVTINTFNNVYSYFESDYGTERRFKCAAYRERIEEYEDEDIEPITEELEFESSEGNYYTGAFFYQEELGKKVLEKYLLYCEKVEEEAIDIINNSFVFVYDKGGETHSSIIHTFEQLQFHDFNYEMDGSLLKEIGDSKALSIIIIAKDVDYTDNEPGVEYINRKYRGEVSSSDFRVNEDYSAFILTAQKNPIPEKYTQEFIRDDEREARYGQQFMKYEHKKLMKYLSKFYENKVKKNMKIKLYEEQYTWYKGSNRLNPLDVSKGDDFYNSTEQYGPGLYFTNKYSTASNYGKVYQYRVSLGNFYKTGDDIDINKLKELINYAPEEDLQIVLEDYDDTGNKEKALRKLLKSVSEYCKDMPDALAQVAHDVFRDDVEEFLMCGRASNIDGVIIENVHRHNDEKFLVLYNPSLAKLENSEVYGEEDEY